MADKFQKLVEHCNGCPARSSHQVPWEVSAKIRTIINQR